MENLLFSSRLAASYRGELESLLFFNPHQQVLSPHIVELVEKYGAPRIVEQGGCLRLGVGEALDVQSLYALAENGESSDLVGALIYTRSDPETLLLLHIAVKEDYAAAGQRARELVTLRLMAKLREIARQLKGVRSISVLYAPGVTRGIPVRPARAIRARAAQLLLTP
jgi:hypothetical protein